MTQISAAPDGLLNFSHSAAAISNIYPVNININTNPPDYSINTVAALQNHRLESAIFTAGFVTTFVNLSNNSFVFSNILNNAWR